MSELNVGCEPQLFLDIKLQEIGEYLKNYLNERLNEYIELNRDELLANCFSVEELELLEIVKTVQYGDLPTTSSLECPILKIYRISSNWKRTSNLRETFIGITYVLNLPIAVRLPGLLNWVTVYMNKAIQNYIYLDSNVNPIRTKDWLNEIQTTYNVLQLASQLREDVIYTLRITIKILES